MFKVIDKICAICAIFLPSCVRPYTPESLLPAQHRTSHMNGLRGIAALIVFIQHWVLYQFPDLRSGYSTTQNNGLLFQLPFLRIIAAGSGAVSVFFVISGFVLSASSLKSIHQQDFSALQSTISSSAFRRILRLYLPVLPSTFITVLWSFAGSPYPEGAREETIKRQIVSWWKTLLITIDPFQDLDIRSPRGPPYAGQLWTLPFEYRGSMVIFLAVLATSRLQLWARLCLIAFIALYAFFNYYWDIFLFLSGILIAQIDFIVAETSAFEVARYCTDRTELQDLEPCQDYKGYLSFQKYTLRLLGQFGFIAGAAVCVHILAFPILDQQTALGYCTLVSFTPKLYASQPNMGIGTGTERFWLSVSAVIFVTLLSLSSTLQRPFRTRFAQIMGEISYSLYIIHVPMVYTLGRWLMERNWVGGSGVGLGFALSSLILIPVVLWTADIYSRLVDMNSVNFAKWLYGQLHR